MNACLCEGFIDTSLVRAECAAALQDQSDAFEWQLSSRSCAV